MGISLSKHAPQVAKKTEEIISDSVPEETPKHTRILPFDPRSPSCNFSRTPITVISGSPSKVTDSTPVSKVITKISDDPRSPTVELIRTPIVVEEQSNDRKHQPLKPSKVISLGFLSISPNLVRERVKDPRSPTATVPRTPLDEAANIEDSDIPETSCEENVQHDAKSGLSNKLFSDYKCDKDRRPLSCLQNMSGSQPREQIQARYCRNVEEEFAKNEKNILQKLETKDNIIKTNTEFVENI